MVIVQRENDLHHWLKSIFQPQSFELIALPGDASFRRYYRLISKDQKYIVMDAPPDKEDCKPFVAVAISLSQHQINTPLIYQQDLNQGFLLLSDFGDDVYLRLLNANNANQLYEQAIDSLVQLQTCSQISNHFLEKFDAKFMLAELHNFDQWFITLWLELNLTAEQQTILHNTYQFLISEAAAQPQVLIHRDYHSRNLMVTPTSSPGVLDFQDAMLGPISYDLVSLLRDCYIAWPISQVHNWVDYYLTQAKAKKIIADNISRAQFIRWFDLMGIQRHLKAAFIFARKKLRDDSEAYLQDIPRTLNYVFEVAQHYPELRDFYQFCQHYIKPRINL